jgi:hypothetical protein
VSFLNDIREGGQPLEGVGLADAPGRFTEGVPWGSLLRVPPRNGDAHGGRAMDMRGSEIDALEHQIHAARAVIDSWEQGNLDEEVETKLETILKESNENSQISEALGFVQQARKGVVS